MILFNVVSPRPASLVVMPLFFTDTLHANSGPALTCTHLAATLKREVWHSRASPATAGGTTGIKSWQGGSLPIS